MRERDFNMEIIGEDNGELNREDDRDDGRDDGGDDDAGYYDGDDDGNDDGDDDGDDNGYDKGETNDDLDIMSTAKMEQTVRDFNYKRKNKGMSNLDLEVKRISLRVEKMLVALDREMVGKETKIYLSSKYFKSWRADGDGFYDTLVSLRENLENDLSSFCDVEMEKAHKTCSEAKHYFYRIRPAKSDDCSLDTKLTNWMFLKISMGKKIKFGVCGEEEM